jgi:hypothetical protein
LILFLFPDLGREIPKLGLFAVKVCLQEMALEAGFFFDSRGREHGRFTYSSISKTMKAYEENVIHYQ